MAANSTSYVLPPPAMGFKAALVLTLIGAAAAVYRFAVGLGASTHLSDHVPWGLWIGVDVLAGVALAAGGFTIAAAVYIFNMKKYRPIVRPAILTAFIGYIAVVVGLFIDIGKPLSFWHPIVMWNYRSIMFEVVWCITLYSMVLALEFAPVVAERWNMMRLRTFLKFFAYPIVILGIVLSFLHQSSLGGVFLIMPHKIPPLWYSPNMTYMFFISAIALGLATVSFESVVSSRALKRPQENEIVQGLARGIQITLIIYLAVKLVDLANRGALPDIFTSGKASLLFLAEIGVGVILPIVLYSLASIKASVNGLLFASSCVMAGTVLNRLNVNFFAQAGERTSYFPSIVEILVTVGLVSFMILLYRLAVTYLPVFQEQTDSH